MSMFPDLDRSYAAQLLARYHYDVSDAINEMFAEQDAMNGNGADYR